jgi:hypothetical protein
MTKTTRKRAPGPCPKCGSLDVVPILYGYPLPEAMAAADEGKIALGGCCVGERDPRKYCNACGEAFDFPPMRRRTLEVQGA